MTAPEPESALQSKIRQALAHEPGLVLWRNNSGVADYNGTRVRYGLVVGASDLIGMLTMECWVRAPGHDGAPVTVIDRLACGRFIALEVKTARGKVSKEQSMFLALVQRMGGFAAVVRSVDEARAAIARARTGACE